MRRSLVCFTMLAMLSGCTAFASRVGSPAAVAPREFPRTVRLVRTDSLRITRFQARLEADTILGEVANGSPMKVATRDVARWEARRFDSEGTAVMGTLAIVGGKILWEALESGTVDDPGGVALRTP